MLTKKRRRPERGHQGVLLSPFAGKGGGDSKKEEKKKNMIVQWSVQIVLCCSTV